MGGAKRYSGVDRDSYLEISLGNVADREGINKFGRSANVDSGVDTDIWSAPATPVWVAPTQARVHNIVSTSTADDGDPAGTGAQTIRVYGLTSWTTAEVNEDLTMDGTSNVATANSYVIIHRMKILTWGSGGTNAGTITATAVTDGTITARIEIGKGQTEMAIYGVPSTKTLAIHEVYSGIQAATGATAVVQCALLVNQYSDNELTGFVEKHRWVLYEGGTDYLCVTFEPEKKIAGPAIVKVIGNSSTANTEVTAGFNAVVSTN